MCIVVGLLVCVSIDIIFYNYRAIFVFLMFDICMNLQLWSQYPRKVLDSLRF